MRWLGSDLLENVQDEEETEWRVSVVSECRKADHPEAVGTPLFLSARMLVEMIGPCDGVRKDDSIKIACLRAIVMARLARAKCRIFGAHEACFHSWMRGTTAP